MAKSLRDLWWQSALIGTRSGKKLNGLPKSHFRGPSSMGSSSSILSESSFFMGMQLWIPIPRLRDDKSGQSARSRRPHPCRFCKAWRWDRRLCQICCCVSAPKTVFLPSAGRFLLPSAHQNCSASNLSGNHAKSCLGR